ncbi:ribosome-associated translation inhibitor RaiA [Parachlamydia sp. AcF125]|uniref:ribosome hibernation-promoting factor, HPF/YfiA family n=1 Tax=Parachlamydia sp. AcF125 TaxID=2795736 RepID=UPI001BCA495A|nr:ribosome-associated translation inhibitor RaiA [Parachlamydia sp. AcF125]MBS4168665.1 Ribosome hibernation promotion factor [Parachlamydia sp. AcF125]
MNRSNMNTDESVLPYNITVTGRHVLVTEAMKNYAIGKISKIDRFSHRIIDVVITMDIQRQEQRVDIVLKVDHLKIKSHAATDDMYASIDMAVDKLEKQLLKYRSRIKDHQAKKLAIVDMNVNVYQAPSQTELAEVNEQIEDESQRRLEESYKPHTIISKETLPLKILTHNEAIMKMELSGDAFLIFRSENDMKLKVIYRKSDQNYGIIEPEA